MSKIDSNWRRKIDHRIWWLVVLSVVGVIVYRKFDSSVFPSASIDLKLKRSEIKELSRLWANRLGYRKTRVIISTQFSPDDQADNDAKTFLEYEFGVEAANRLMKTDVPVWAWRTRFCQEHQLEELRVWLSPAGELYGFAHDLENDRYLPSISQNDAEKLARDFIEKEAGIPLSDFHKIKKSSNSQLHRVDHSFTWEKTKPDYKGARLRVEASVSGNQITQFSYYLYVPESWQRKFSTVRSYNNLLQTIATIFYVLIDLASIFVFLWGVTSNKIRWRVLLPLTAFVTVISVLDAYNGIADVIDRYNTHNIYLAYLIQFIITTLYGALGEFLKNLILIGAAEVVYRVTYPDKISWENLFSLKGLRNISTTKALFIGYIVLGIHLGWVAIYYLIGQHCHFWCPLDVDQYEILSDVFPFFSALALGVSASITEELMYRVLALGLMQKLTRSFWLANLLQAAAWGFMHSNYAQQPAYARGVELTCVGLFYGWIVRRYGILATLVGHYLLDALLTVKTLWSSKELLFKFSTLLPLVIFLPMGIYGLWQMRKRGVIADTEINNAAIDQLKTEDRVRPLVSPSERVPYTPLPTSLRALILVVALASLTLALPLRKYLTIGENAHVVISRDQAMMLAQHSMLAHHIVPEKFMAIATLTSPMDEIEKQYLFEKLGLKKTVELVEAAEPDYYSWNVRFFRVLDPEEYTVRLDKSGREIDFVITKSEEAAGANLTVDEARQKAEKYLSTHYAIYRPYQFDNFTENHRPARTDYTFTFKVPKLKVAEADFKININLVGEAISDHWEGWDIPDAWEQERQKKHLRDEIFTYMRIVLAVISFLALISFAFQLLKRHRFEWRFALIGAIPFLAVSLLSYADFLPQYYRNYNTTTPLNSFIINGLSSNLQAVFGTLAMYVIGLGFALAAMKEVAPNYSLRHFCATLFNARDHKLRQERKEMWLDSFLTVTACLAVSLMISVVSDLLGSMISPAVPIDNFAEVCPMANCFSPVLNVIYSALLSGANYVIALALLAGLYKKYCKNFWFYFVFIVLITAVPIAGEHYWQDYLIRVIAGIATNLLAWFAVKKLIGLNPLAYFMIGVGQVLVGNLFVLIDHGLPLLLNTLYFVCLMILLPLFYLAYLFLPTLSKMNEQGKPSMKNEPF